MLLAGAERRGREQRSSVPVVSNEDFSFYTQITEELHGARRQLLIPRLLNFSALEEENAAFPSSSLMMRWVNTLLSFKARSLMSSKHDFSLG